MRRLGVRPAAFPEGSVAIAIGLVVAGSSTYGLLIVVARALGASRYAAFSVLWALTFLVGPGFFFPVEQEVSRGLAARLESGQGGRPLVVRTAALSGLAALALSLLSLAVWPGLLRDLFDGQLLLLAAFLLSLWGLAALHLMRGIFSGTGTFGRYAFLAAGEGAVRLVVVAGLAVGGVHHAGPYGLALGLGSLLAVLAVVPGRARLEPGPTAEWRELSTRLGFLVAASLLSQFLVNVGPLAVKLLASPAEKEVAGRFLSGLVLTRVPLFFFLAIQAPLLPKLARMAEAGQHADFRHGLRRLVVAVTGIGAAGTVLGALFGPAILRTVFGPDFVLGRWDLAAMAGASSAYMLALTLSSGLVALSRHGLVAVGWAAGTVVMLVAMAAIPGLLGRVEVAFLAGTVVSAGSMGVMLLVQQRALGVMELDALGAAVSAELIEP